MKKTIEKTKEKDMTIKQRKWLDIYLQTGNASEAAMKVYKCKSRESAAVIGHENLRKLNYEDFMEAAGITDHLLQQKIMEGLGAERTISANVIVKSNDPKVRNKQATARDIDFIDVPDYAIRHRYLETALKLKKRLIDRVDNTSDDKPLPTPIIQILNVSGNYSDKKTEDSK